MLSRAKVAPIVQIQLWPIDRFVPYIRHLRRNAAAVDRMCSSIREFGFKVPCLVRGDGEVVDGDLRLKAARKLGLTEVPVILCDEWTLTQVKAFRLLVNRSAVWADWDKELLAVEFQELSEAYSDLSLTGFDPREIDDLLLLPNEDQRENAAPPLSSNPVSRPGDLWLCGRPPHRILCADATSPDAVAHLLGKHKPILMVTDPPYGIELDSEWRDRAGLNGCGPAQPSYLKRRTEGHTQTTISGDTRADWSDAFALLPSLQIGYVWHASVFTAEVLAGLLRIGFLYPQQIIWNKGRPVLTRTHYWYQHEPCWYLRKKNAPWFGKALAAALSRSDTPLGLTVTDGRTQDLVASNELPKLVKSPAAYFIEYRDGLKATLLMLDGAIKDFNFAARLKGSKEIWSTQFLLTPDPNVTYSACLMHKAEQMFETGVAPYPVERTLLTSGILESCLASKLQNNARLETPHLQVVYQAPQASQFAQT